MSHPCPLLTLQAWSAESVAMSVPVHRSLSADSLPGASSPCHPVTSLGPPLHWQLEGSAPQTLMCSPESGGSRPCGSHHKTSGIFHSLVRGVGGPQGAHCVVQRALSFILQNCPFWRHQPPPQPPLLRRAPGLSLLPSPPLPWPFPAPPGAGGPLGS